MKKLFLVFILLLNSCSQTSYDSSNRDTPVITAKTLVHLIALLRNKHYEGFSRKQLQDAKSAYASKGLSVELLKDLVHNLDNNSSVLDKRDLIQAQKDGEFEDPVLQLFDEQYLYLKIPYLSYNTAKLVKEKLTPYQNKYQHLIIDVRNSPGGLVQAAVDVSDLFIGSGKTLLYNKDRDNRITHTFTSKKGGLVFKLTVLTNHNTANGAEILAGNLKAYAGAKLIGTKTYGQNSVFTVYSLAQSDYLILKLYTHKWFLNDGIDIEDKGLRPNIVHTFIHSDIKMTYEEIKPYVKMYAK